MGPDGFYITIIISSALFAGVAITGRGLGRCA